MLELVSITKATDGKHKWVAKFMRDGREKNVPFGGYSYTDFTLGASEDQRENYIRRHSNSRENFNDPTTPASLSRYILWGPTRSFSENLRLFKRRFGL